MFYDGLLKGQYVDLKACSEEDAEFTLGLRQDSSLTKYLPRLDISIDQQRAWIRGQRGKEGDYFFVIMSKDGKRLGTVGVYDIHDGVGESGRLAAIGDAFQNTEGVYLLHKFAFDILHLEKLTSYVYADNKRAIRFNSQFGGILLPPEENADGEMIRRSYLTREQFYDSESKLIRLLRLDR